MTEMATLVREGTMKAFRAEWVSWMPGDARLDIETANDRALSLRICGPEREIVTAPMLTPDQARRVASYLLEAADAVDAALAEKAGK